MKSDEEIKDAAAPEPGTYPWHKCRDQSRDHHTFLHEGVDELLREKASLEAENERLREDLSDAHREIFERVFGDEDEDDASPDFLDEMIKEFTARNPEFPRLLEEACRRREVSREDASRGSGPHPRR